MALPAAGTIDVFFSLLRSGLYGTPVPESELPVRIEWEAVVDLAKKHAVDGIIIDSVQLLPEHLRPTGALSVGMTQTALSIIRANIIMDKAVARLVGFLRGHGIEGVLLKGQGMARAYRSPQSRQCGDIDFYVGKEAYAEVVELCRKEFMKGTRGVEETSRHLLFYLDGVPVELHREASNMYSPLNDRKYQKWIVGELEHSPRRRVLTIDNTAITLPSYDFDAIFIFYHALQHYFMGGVGLRQLCDLAMLFHTHGAEIDRKRFEENIRRFGLTKAWHLFAYIVVNYLGVDAAKMPLYDPSCRKRAEKVLHEILLDGNFGFCLRPHKVVRTHKNVLMNELVKIRTINKYSAAMFPINPQEAVALYFRMLFHGIVGGTKRVFGKRRRR